MSLITYRCRKIDEFPTNWGQVVQCPAQEATVHSDIFSYWDGIASFRVDGEAVLSWFELKRRSFKGKEVERHHLTSEALLCIQGGAICFVGEPVDSEKMDPQRFGAFYLEQGRGLILAPGTWHALPFPVTEKAVFWVIFRKGTAQMDLEMLNIELEKGFRFQVSLNDHEKE